MKRNSKTAKPPPAAPDKHQVHSCLKPYVGYCFYRAAMHIRSKVDARLEPFGVVAPQFGMLMVLRNHGAKTQNDLGHMVAMDKATMVRMIDGLEALGYVARVPSKEDRRANHLEITKTGRHAVVQMDIVRLEAEQEALARLTVEERAKLISIVSKLLQN